MFEPSSCTEAKHPLARPVEEREKEGPRTYIPTTDVCEIQEFSTKFHIGLPRLLSFSPEPKVSQE